MKFKRKIKDELIEPTEECLNYVENGLKKLGWKIVKSGDLMFGGKHYQVTKENENKIDFKFPHLDELIEKLNSSIVYDGEEFESGFKFEYRLKTEFNDEGEKLYILQIFDTYEEYTYEYEDDMYWNLVDTYREFGGKKPDRYEITDDIMPQFEEAIRQDLEQYNYDGPEWENLVIFNFYIFTDENIEKDVEKLSNFLDEVDEKFNCKPTYNIGFNENEVLGSVDIREMFVKNDQNLTQDACKDSFDIYIDGNKQESLGSKEEALNKASKLQKQNENKKVEVRTSGKNVDDTFVKDSKELDRKLFYSLIKLGDHPYDGYSILNDGYFVKRIYADSDLEAKKLFREYINNHE